VQKTTISEKEQENVVLSLAERRMILILAAVEALISALIHRSFESGWAHQVFIRYWNILITPVTKHKI